MVLSRKQKIALALIAAFGFLGPNGIFLYYAFFRYAEMMRAMNHPVTLALMFEAFMLVGIFAAYFAWKPLGKWGWKSFIALSLFGGLAFSIPTFVLINSPEPNR